MRITPRVGGLWAQRQRLWKDAPPRHLILINIGDGKPRPISVPFIGPTATQKQLRMAMRCWRRQEARQLRSEAKLAARLQRKQQKKSECQGAYRIYLENWKGKQEYLSMTKLKSVESEALVVPDTASEELAALKAAGIDLDDQTGKDSIDNRNLVLPFLALCQKTSPQLDPSDPRYTEGLKFLDLFKSLNGTVARIYGTKPVAFIPIVIKEHAIEFHPFDGGGGVKDRDVSLDDPRCRFHGDDKPVATVFLDFAVLLLPELEPAILSFKSTNLKTGYLLKTLVKTTKKAPMYAQRYEVTSGIGKNSFGTYGVFVIQPAGFVTPEQALFAKRTIETWADKNIVVEHEADEEVVPRMSMSDEPVGAGVPF